MPSRGVSQDGGEIVRSSLEKESGVNSSQSHSSASSVNEIDNGRRRASRVVESSVTEVPRAQRRGLLGTWTLVPEVVEPKDYSNRMKWFITAVVSVAGAAGPTASAILFPALENIQKTLHASATVTNLSVAFYMLALAIFPLWWSSFSETMGRRSIYLISFTLFTILTTACALSTSIEMLIAFRLLSGGASASVQAVGAGTIADIWEVKERGRAIGFFYLGPLCGPLLAPIIGGAVSQKWGWRATQWFLAIYGGVVVVLTLFALPETLQRPKSIEKDEPEPSASTIEPTLSKTSTRQSIQQHSKRYALLAHRFFIEPLSILTYLRFPAVFLTVYYASITFGCLYVLNVSIQQTFAAPPYRFSTIIIGCLYLPNSVGYLLASIFGGRWTDYIMAREARAAGRVRWEKDEKAEGGEREVLGYLPEDRMRENTYLAAALYPAALIWYGWTVQKGVFWVVPLVANFFFGIGSMLVFAAALTMLTEFMPKRASSGVALNNFMRSLFSCVGAIAGSPLIDSIGNGWLFTALGGLAGASGIVIWLMRRHGAKWRERMVKEMQ